MRIFSRHLFAGLLFTSGLTGLDAQQNSYNTWLLGNHAGLDFSSGGPVPIPSSSINTQEGCASISDGTGALLFYTDGLTIWNKQHLQMPNGTGLTGNSSTSQSALIVQRPGSNASYFIFTADAQAGIRGIRYSEVDMTLCGGLGNVTSVKNVLLISPSCEKLAAIRHCNQRDVWVVTHDWNSDAFRTFLVTSSGVNTTPVISHCGITISGSSLNAAGCLRGSPDGHKLASGTEDQLNRFELFDFDNSTGVVSNSLLFPQLGIYAYGVEFSRDGTKLYGSTLSPHEIYQFDLCAGSPSAIANSGTLIGTAGNVPGSLQLGPDDKIYVARLHSTWLGVIDHPEQGGQACNYIDNGVNLGSGQSGLGLANFIPYYFPSPVSPFTYVNHCLNVQFQCPASHPGSCSAVSTAPLSVHWEFGDPLSGNDNFSSANDPLHTFSATGNYSVTLIIYRACSSDTLHQQVNVTQPGLLTIATTTACNDYTGTATVSGYGPTNSLVYSWLPGGQTSATATGLQSGNYIVYVTDSSGCLQKDTALISFSDPPTAVALASKTIDIGSSVDLHAEGGNTYRWFPAEGLNCISCSDPVASPFATTDYCVEVTDRSGCKDTACVSITVNEPVYIPNAFTPGGDGLNDVFMPVVNEVQEYTLEIYDRWGAKVFGTTSSKQGWTGEDAMAGVYVYRVTYRDVPGNREHRIEGRVTLLK